MTPRKPGTPHKGWKAAARQRHLRTPEEERHFQRGPITLPLILEVTLYGTLLFTLLFLIILGVVL